MIFFDIETNGLKLEEITKIHCIVLSNNGHLMEYTSNFGSLLGRLMDPAYGGTSFLCGHNVIAYDIPVLQKFYPWFKPKKVIDTLLLSRMSNPDRLAGHSLASYSDDLGTEKIKNEDWSICTVQMIERCKNDVILTEKLYKQLMAAMDNWEGWKWPIQIEHKVAQIIAEQVTHGWMFDIATATTLKVGLEQQIADIDHDLSHLLSPKCIQISDIKKPFNKNGQETSQVRKYFTEPVSGPCSVIQFEPINLSSEKQMKELLLSLGWAPTQWNYKKNENRRNS